MSQREQSSDQNPYSPVASSQDVSATQPSHLGRLAALGVATTLAYALINWLSWQFTYDSINADRPIISVLMLFAFAFVAYLVAISIAKRASQDRKLVWIVLGFALLFRLVMVFSHPIQEVDIYRYLWDGEVMSQGVSPFQFSPEEVMTASLETENLELETLVALRVSNPHVAEVLRRVHFGQLPTIYPPTSQLVFFSVAMITPSDASVLVRVWIMKAVLIGFDLGVLFLLIKLLAICRLPIGLSLIYAWCPLVMKEVANSGHLDTIAVFLSVLAVYLFIRFVAGTKATTDRPSSFTIAAGTLMVALVLAAAVGAKLYPVVLAPLLFGGIVRRFGWRAVLLPAAVFAVASFLLLLPILPSGQTATPVKESASAVQLTNPQVISQPPSTTATDSSLGVTTFLKYWEMNDFIFMIAVENLKLDSAEQAVWFSVLPEGFRQPVANSVARMFSIPVAEAPFMTTRAITSLMFLLIALWIAWRVGSKIHQQQTGAGQDNGQLYCEAAFLTLAWFWLLLPTQNPWYWLWALPFLPFVRNRAWLAVSGIVLVYYFRFWLEYHFDQTPVLGTPYQGTAFFDFVVTWLEFAPWFIWLAANRLRQGKGNHSLKSRESACFAKDRVASTSI